MIAKTTPSTEVQHNFACIFDDAGQNDIRNIIIRRNTPCVIAISKSDLQKLLTRNEIERREIGTNIRELNPVYNLGKTVKP